MAQHRLAALRGQPLSLDWTCFGGGVLYEERFGVDRECDPELAARVHPLHELQGTPDAPGLYRYPVASGATLYVDRDPYHPTPPLCEDLFTSHSTFVTPKNVHHFLKFCNNLFYFLIWRIKHLLHAPLGILDFSVSTGCWRWSLRSCSRYGGGLRGALAGLRPGPNPPHASDRGSQSILGDL